jgi:hypothetical protein
MRFDLEVDRSEDGVLAGNLGWAGQDPPRSFHGLLELVALLETAIEGAMPTGQHG